MKVKYDLVVDFARPSKSNTIMISENDNYSRELHFTLLNNKQPMSMSDVESAIIQATKKDGSVVGGVAEILEDDNGNAINELTYTIPNTMTDDAGLVTMVVKLQSNTAQVLTSFEIYLQVRNALYNEDDYVSEDDFHDFFELYNTAKEEVEKLQELAANETLKNPYPIKITYEGVTYTYDGATTVNLSINDVAYIADDPVTDVTPIDNTAASSASSSANSARQYAEAAAGSASDAEDACTSAEGYATTAMNSKNTVVSAVGQAESYTLSSKNSALVSEGWAKGTQNGVAVTESSPYYRKNAEFYASRFSIEDRLDSADKDKSLSANQGRVLNDTKQNKLTAGANITIANNVISAASGTTDYTELDNKPKINSVELSGNKTLADIGAASASTVSTLSDTVSSQKESLNKYEQSGFLSKNIFDGWIDGMYLASGDWSAYTNRIASHKIKTPKNAYTLSFTNNTSTNVTIAFVGWNNGTMTSRNASWKTSNANSQFSASIDTTNYSEIAFFAYTTGDTVKPTFASTQLEEGTEKTSYTEYALGNTDLTNQMNDAYDYGYISTLDKIDTKNVLLNEFYSPTDGNPSGYRVGRFSTKDYIDVSKIKKIKLVADGTVSVNVHFYNANKVWQSSEGTWNALPHEVTIASNIAYVRFSFNLAERVIVQSEVDALNIKLLDMVTPSNASLKESLSQLSTPQTLNMVNLSGINSVIRKRAKQIGTLCTINALIQVKACSSDNWTQLFQLPSSARPDSNIDFGMTCGATPYSAQGLINTDGIVQIKPPSNILEGTYVTMNVAYTLI